MKRVFDVVCENGTLKFRCSNDDTKQDWVDAIQLCIKKELEKIKPPKNVTGKCDICFDIYECCFELHERYDRWNVVWPLLKLNEKSNDENKSSDDETKAKILYFFDNEKDRDNQILDKAIKIYIIFQHIFMIFMNIFHLIVKLKKKKNLHHNIIV